jgi:hypothetical protein
MMRIRRDAFLWTKEDITEGMGPGVSQYCI